jgi:hypothetical protein
MRSLRGVSLVDVLVGSAIFLVVFVALFGILRASVSVSGLAKARASATAIASAQIEYIRSLDYDAAGTVGGIPTGAILQNQEVTQAGTTFNVRTYLIYKDDTADGTGGADSNGVTTDYKIAKVVVSYTIAEISRDVTLITNISPRGLETTAGGGTLRITIVDALGLPVAGATVRVVNDTLGSPVDITTFSDISGTVLFGGAPASIDYEIFVSKTGYSSAQTYERDSTNVNPTPGFLTVAEGQTTTGTFAVDVLGALTIQTFAPPTTETFEDSFADFSKLYSRTGTDVSVGSLVLEGSPPSYTASGSAVSSTTQPTYLSAWTSASAEFSLPVGTQATFHIADGNGTLLPDTALTGNSTGFTSTVNLSSVSVVTYPALSLVATLSTSDGNVTPEILSWELSYSDGPTPIPNVSITLTGSKTIGSTSGGASIYKTTIATTTDSSGTRSMSIEWDSYTLSVTGFTVQSEDPVSPYELLPSTSVTGTLILTP